MSLHSSLKRVEKITATRTVLSRVERIKRLLEDGRWSKIDKVVGLPKIKILKLKIKKAEKAPQEKAQPQSQTEVQTESKEGKK